MLEADPFVRRQRRVRTLAIVRLVVTILIAGAAATALGAYHSTWHDMDDGHFECAGEICLRPHYEPDGPWVPHTGYDHGGPLPDLLLGTTLCLAAVVAGSRRGGLGFSIMLLVAPILSMITFLPIHPIADTREYLAGDIYYLLCLLMCGLAIAEIVIVCRHVHVADASAIELPEARLRRHRC
jgi:hypothetical protein